MEEIRIQLAEVSELANEIRNINTELLDTLDGIKSIMRQLNAVWTSTGAETILDRFDRFALRFQEEYETIDNYARFLDRTVASYDSLESTITSNASNFS